MVVIANLLVQIFLQLSYVETGKMSIYTWPSSGSKISFRGFHKLKRSAYDLNLEPQGKF